MVRLHKLGSSQGSGYLCPSSKGEEIKADRPEKTRKIKWKKIRKQVLPNLEGLISLEATELVNSETEEDFDRNLVTSVRAEVILS